MFRPAVVDMIANLTFSDWHTSFEHHCDVASTTYHWCITCGRLESSCCDTVSADGAAMATKP